jgi:hypothetical protein
VLLHLWIRADLLDYSGDGCSVHVSNGIGYVFQASSWLATREAVKTTLYALPYR